MLARAGDFFAEYGLTAQTRPLAAACGVTQRLLYRYFPSKAALLAEVYGEAIIAPFKAVWIVQLKNRAQPLEERLFTFYRNYYRGVLTRKWLRLFLYASLAEANMAPDYTQAILMEMLETVVAEVAHDQGVLLPRQRKIIHEIGWILHGAVSHLAIRRHIYRLSQEIDEDRTLALHVRSFIAGFAATVATARSPTGNGTRQARK
ncbi:MAG: TetR/AcrR family transcriptional regulator [Alphaproteobacteria bacterium]|nr:TetR/AcrR family transcriptional regulator [Alphaproteobacteria bacterium]